MNQWEQERSRSQRTGKDQEARINDARDAASLKMRIRETDGIESIPPSELSRSCRLSFVFRLDWFPCCVLSFVLLCCLFSLVFPFFLWITPSDPHWFLISARTDMLLYSSSLQLINESDSASIDILPCCGLVFVSSLSLHWSDHRIGSYNTSTFI